jgi:hypothetical protein
VGWACSKHEDDDRQTSRAETTQGADEEHSLRVFEKKVLKGISGPKTDEVNRTMEGNHMASSFISPNMRMISHGV